MPNPTTSSGLAVPAIHLNGTGGDDLLEQTMDALHAIRAAHAALRRMSPHQRDYYVQSTGAWARASDEYIARLAKLEGITTELEEITLYLSGELLSRQRTI